VFSWHRRLPQFTPIISGLGSRFFFHSVNMRVPLKRETKILFACCLIALLHFFLQTRVRPDETYGIKNATAGDKQYAGGYKKFFLKIIQQF
jgi:hypothetical protein